MQIFLRPIPPRPAILSLEEVEESLAEGSVENCVEMIEEGKGVMERE